MFNYIRVHTQ